MTAIVPGSLKAISKQAGVPLAETFINADTIILIDTSGSMNEHDMWGPANWGEDLPLPQSRYDVACDELAKLQASLPGKIAVISFATWHTFCPGGRPPKPSGNTNLADALDFVHVADDCGIRFIVISDGQPNSESAALAAAGKFKSSIDTIYVGPKGGEGADFLRRLAQASGGQTVTANQVKALAVNVQRLLEAKAA